MTASCVANFKRNYQTHLKHLRLKGCQLQQLVYARHGHELMG